MSVELQERGLKQLAAEGERPARVAQTAEGRCEGAVEDSRAMAWRHTEVDPGAASADHV